MEQFYSRHIGITPEDTTKMLETIGVASLDDLIRQTIPNNILRSNAMNLPQAMSEWNFLNHIHKLACKNELFDNYIGLGYYGTATPSVIVRNVFENPVWYTSYTPYQAEISQGRLEALFNFQTVICDLTAMPLANCSLLDEATAAAEAMTMMFRLRNREQQKQGVTTLLIDKNIFPQTLSVLKNRALSQDIDLLVTDITTFQFDVPVFGAIVQYPDERGLICDYSAFCTQCHDKGAKLTAIADLMSLILLIPPGEWNADIVVGTTQRFGLPMGYGGPSAAYMATREEFKRDIPGRIVGLSQDSAGKPAYRLALQMREQHIKREKATSNICTAQALPAIMAGFYAVYNGAEGLLDIAISIHLKAVYLESQLRKLGYSQLNKDYFDTLQITIPQEVTICDLRCKLEDNHINVRYIDNTTIGISIDETTSTTALAKLIRLFADLVHQPIEKLDVQNVEEMHIQNLFLRKSSFLTDEVFKKYHSETEMMRYIKRLERKDISLTHSMIPLGSCTMKLNAASEMLPTVWMEFLNQHPFEPRNQVQGYNELINNLSGYLAEITGFAAVNLQPTSGAAGEYTGLITIRNYLQSKGESQRVKMLIPASAHGTNPASAAQAGFSVIVTNCDDNGNVDVADLKQKAEENRNELAGLMITYPSTHGIFEPEIREICQIIHNNGGQVFMDGANMNGQVGLTSPGQIGADVCHLNLHKTFASPHGGGGPGVGAIAVSEHLKPFMPQHIFTNEKAEYNAVSAAPWGNASLLPITYGYIRMMGAEGLVLATKTAILNANYLAKRLEKYYGIVYTGATGRVGHELILDCRPFKTIGVTETDIAKRLMDYGFHAPTLSFPVHGTLMIEPTESESLAELDRFVDAMIAIRSEITEIAEGKADPINNVLVNAPHPEYKVAADAWNYPYSRQKAAFPMEWVAENKFWIPVGRVDNGAGDRNLICKR